MLYGLEREGALREETEAEPGGAARALGQLRQRRPAR
jgi:hypothetical protein